MAALSLVAQDSGGLQSNPIQYNVLIEDANETPSITTSAFTVRDDTPGTHTIIGRVAASDPDPSPVFNGLTYKITGGTGGSLFSMNPSTGDIYLDGTLNGSTTPLYTLNVTATDSGGLSTTRGITINVTPTNHAPQPTGVGSTFNVRATVGKYVGRIYANDPDPGDAAVYQVVNIEHFGETGNNPAYSITSSGDVYAQYAGEFSQAFDDITVRVTDSGGLSNQVIIRVTYNADKPWAPVVLDLDADGVELVSLTTSAVTYDMDRDGIRDRTGWVAADDALLVLDRNKNGVIDDPDEFSFVNDLVGARSDLEGLRAFDTNGNGVFEANDRQFAEFQVWQDANQDGVSQADELTTLDQRDIRSIQLDLTETGQVVEGAIDNVLFARSKFTRPNGTTGDIGDVFLAYASGVEETSANLSMFGGGWLGSTPLKTRAKTKFLGIEDTKPLPDKLKRTRASNNASDVAAPFPVSQMVPGNNVPKPAASKKLVTPEDDTSRAPAEPVERDRAAETDELQSGNSVRPWQPASDRDLASSFVSFERADTSDESLADAALLLSQSATISLNVVLEDMLQSTLSRSARHAYSNGVAPDGLGRLLIAMAEFRAGEGVGAVSQIAAPLMEEAAQLAPAV